MGAHVWGPMYMLRHLLPHGEVSGWTPDWYAGFPAFGYYMVGPAIAIVALHVGTAVWAAVPLALLALALAASGWVVPRLFVLRKVLAVVGLVPGADHRPRPVQHRLQAGDGVGTGVAPDLRLGVRQARRPPLPGAAGVRAGRARVRLQPGAADPLPQRRRRDRHRQHHRRQHALDDGGRVLVLHRALARAPLPGGAAARPADGSSPGTGRRACWPSSASATCCRSSSCCSPPRCCSWSGHRGGASSGWLRWGPSQRRSPRSGCCPSSGTAPTRSTWASSSSRRRD